MGLLKIKFEVMNDTQFARAFETASEEVRDLSPVFEKMGDEFFVSMSSVFSAEGAFEGRTRWAELSPAYKRWKQRHLPGRKILERTGRLLASLAVRGASDNVFEITKDSLIVGTRVPYAIYHQFGTRKMPMRKIIELTADQKIRWTHLVHAYLFSIYDKAAKATRGE